MKGFFKFGSPMVELTLEKIKIEPVLDTGFNGHLMLPQGIIDKLGLEQLGSSDFTTASGEEKQTKVYKANIEFLDKEMEVPILSTEADFSLAGMELFHNCKITIERCKAVVEIIESKSTEELD